MNETESGTPVAEPEGEPGAVAESKPEPDRARRWVSAEALLTALGRDRAPSHRDYLSNRRKPGPWVRT